MENEEYFGEMHDRALKNPYLQASYLDRFNLDKSYGDLEGMSAVVPTYNRAPHTPEEDANPLGWCLESLLAQEGPGLREIVIVDDASTDYTGEVVRYFSEISEIPIVYHKNKRNLGSSKTKNIGSKISGNNLVLFLDDDCIFNRHMFFGASYLWRHLNEEGDLGAIHFPVYQRKTVPDSLLLKKIGVFDQETGEILGNHNAFPMEYALNLDDHFIGGDLRLLKPFEISTLAGIFVSRKDILEEVGGYPEFFSWKNGYREETHLGLEMKNAGFRLFLTPDPKLSCVHLKYGAHGQEGSQNLDPRIGRLVNQSNSPRLGTGNRVDPEEWFFSRIISTFVTLGIRDLNVAKKYASETHRTFVENNLLSMSGVEGVKIDDEEHRKEIFDRAINEGKRLINKQRSLLAS